MNTACTIPPTTIKVTVCGRKHPFNPRTGIKSKSIAAVKITECASVDAFDSELSVGAEFRPAIPQYTKKITQSTTGGKILSRSTGQGLRINL